MPRVICSNCGGSGNVVYHTEKVCGPCRGLGKISFPSGYVNSCSYCNGSGVERKAHNRKCDKCRGRGKIDV